ncbi:MAG: hypothetical protein H6971_03275 [Gammaproteobacteria bacterium]|nr:hypothetical protein [Gammaproteobacteria bacterium]
MTCNRCERQGSCELEPQARELGVANAQQWISCTDETPPMLEAILFLEYPSDMPLGTVRHGYYDADSEVYMEWTSGLALPAQAVIAWMQVPDVPKAIYQGHRRVVGRSRRKPALHHLSFLEG